jgi:hypothetical protein
MKTKSSCARHEGRGRMYKKNGMWVFDSGETVPAEVVSQTIGRVRAQRDRRNLGKFKG